MKNEPKQKAPGEEKLRKEAILAERLFFVDNFDGFGKIIIYRIKRRWYIEKYKKNFLFRHVGT